MDQSSRTAKKIRACSSEVHHCSSEIEFWAKATFSGQRQPFFWSKATFSVFFEAFHRAPWLQPSLINYCGRESTDCGHHLTVIHQKLTPASDCGRENHKHQVYRPRIAPVLQFIGREREGTAKNPKLRPIN